MEEVITILGIAKDSDLVLIKKACFDLNWNTEEQKRIELGFIVNSNLKKINNLIENAHLHFQTSLYFKPRSQDFLTELKNQLNSTIINKNVKTIHFDISNPDFSITQITPFKESYPNVSLSLVINKPYITKVFYDDLIKNILNWALIFDSFVFRTENVDNSFNLESSTTILKRLMDQNAQIKRIYFAGGMDAMEVMNKCKSLYDNTFRSFSVFADTKLRIDKMLIQRKVKNLLNVWAILDDYQKGKKK